MLLGVEPSPCTADGLVFWWLGVGPLVALPMDAVPLDTLEGHAPSSLGVVASLPMLARHLQQDKVRGQLSLPSVGGVYKM